MVPLDPSPSGEFLEGPRGQFRIGRRGPPPAPDDRREVVEQAIAPLRLIFWGGLLWILDFHFTQTTNGRGFRFDVLNDVLATALIAFGVLRLASLPVHARYGRLMVFLLVVSVLAVANAIRDHFVVPLGPEIQLAIAIFDLVVLVAVVLFTLAMRWFCEEHGLAEAARSWYRTTLLFAFLYLVPLGLLQIAGWVASALERPFHLELGMLALLLIPLFAIPIIHMFVSTSRMKRAAVATALAR